jgi:hypothetical protein
MAMKRLTWDSTWRASMTVEEIDKQGKIFVATIMQAPLTNKQKLEALSDVEAFVRGDPCPEFVQRSVHGKPNHAHLSVQ